MLRNQERKRRKEKETACERFYLSEHIESRQGSK